jgi:tetraacyldisaccharide 4'-kinase
VVWGAVARRNYERATPYRAKLPVICIGNFTVGGTGKTPLALFVASELQQSGKRPVFLTRGYGGRLAGPHWVNTETDTATDVGDEPLLLARRAPTLVARDRAAGARAIEVRANADVVIMDDGLQNPALAKDLTLALVDGRRGIGNGRVIPAGPLRAPLDFQLDLADAVVVNGPLESADAEPNAAADWLRARFPGPVLSASVHPADAVPWLDGTAVIAYAGIGAPQRFFDLLARLGADVRQTIPFPDHHAFTEADAGRLLDLAGSMSAQLVTTEKDWVRLDPAGGATAKLKAASRPLPVAMRFDERDRGRLAALLETAFKRDAAP